MAGQRFTRTRVCSNHIIIYLAALYCLPLSACSAMAQSDKNPQKGVQGAFHWVDKPRIEFKPTDAQLRLIAEATQAKKQRFSLPLTAEQTALLQRMFDAKVTETTVQRLKIPQTDLKISVGSDYSFEYPHFYYTECSTRAGKSSCLTYQHALQKEIIRGESRPSMQAIAALKIEPVFTKEQRKKIEEAFLKGQDDVTIGLTANQNALFKRMFGAADRKEVRVMLMPVKPAEIRLKKNSELGTKGCRIGSWETSCDSVGCHMLCKPVCD